MIRNAKAYLELIRIPGVFTAHADIVAGAFIAGAGVRQLPDLIVLLIASSCFFSAGMALNDYFDCDIDRLERPSRPIPSGRVAEGAALFLGMALLATGIISCYFVSGISFTIALLLTLAIVSYDGRLKNVAWAGPVNMGFCRYLNLLLGMSILPLNYSIMLIPLLLWLYIFGITVLSSNEVKGRDPISVGVCLSCIAGVAVLYWLFIEMDIIQRYTGIYFCLIWMGIALIQPLRLLFKPTPADYQKAVKWLLLFLVILDGAIVAGVRSEVAAIFVCLFIFPGGYIAKRFYVT
jgi:4-hydroxybenzoate polyprenyltransferase